MPIDLREETYNILTGFMLRIALHQAKNWPSKNPFLGFFILEEKNVLYSMRTGPSKPDRMAKRTT